MKLTAKVLVPILAVSISQIAGATPFFSAASLDWSDPAAWTATVGFPDTFTTDRATINATHTINYTGGVSGTDGGLSIANGNTVTIRGGLTQTTVTTAIRVGEGTGGTGIGTLTIAGGGTLNTGAAIGLGIGTSFDGVAFGDGLMEIINGTLTMGAGAANGGLGIGLDGSTGVLNVGDGIGAADAVVDLFANNIQMGVGAAFAFTGGGTGTVNIMSDGLIKFASRDINIGANGGNGTIVISSGGALTGGSGRIIVGNTGSTGTLTTDGTVSNTGEILVGNGAFSMGLVTQNSGAVSGNDFHVGRSGGNGTYTLNSGTVSFTNEMQIGAGGGSTGLLEVLGATSSVVVASSGGDPFARVGSGGGTGTVNITGGGTLNTTNTWFTLGENNGSTGTATVDGAGSTLTSHGLIVGWNGLATGNLTISNGAVVNNSGHEVSIGRDNGGANSPTGTININSGGTLNAGNDLRVGHNATGTVNINGGTLNAQGGWAIVGEGGTANGTINMTAGTVNSADWMIIGNNTGAQGALNIGGGIFNVNAGGDSGRLITGRLGTAVVNQSAGDVNVGNWFAIGIDPGGNGTYNMSGGTLSVRSNIDIANRGTGVMTITNGNAAGTTITGNSTGGVVNAFNAGADTGGNGTLNIALANGTDRIISRELYAGNNAGTVGVINVNGGTLQTNEWVEIGRNGGTGSVNVSGPTAVWNRGTVGALGQAKDVQIGYNGGTGNLNVSNGGTVNQNWWFNVARGAGSTGHLTVDGIGSTINMINGREDGHGGDNNAQLNVGEDGIGTLVITNGGTFNQSMFLGGGVTVKGGGEVHIGRNGGSNGTVTVDGAGSTFNSFAREFRIADNNSTGTLNITNGGVVNFASHNENGTIGGGNFGVAENNAANGTINMSNGTLNVTGWSLFTGWNQAASTATINMANNSHINIIDDGTGNGRGHFFLGDAGTSILNQEGGSISAQGWSAIGRERGGNSTYNLGVNGGGGTFTVGGAGGGGFYVGRQSHGTIVMGVGTSITTTQEMNLAQETSPTTPSSGTVLNNGGSLSVGGEFNIGRNGPNANVGLYTQTDGSLLVSGEVFVGRDSTKGTLNLTGGTAQLNNNLGIGQGSGGSVGEVNITNAAMNVNGWTTMGRDTGGSATSSKLNVGAGGVFNHATGINGDFLLGWQNGSTAQVNVTAGGLINYGWWTRVGVDPGSNGSVLVDGTGSTFNVNDGRVYIGEKAIGTLTISNGGKFAHHSGYEFGVGEQDGGAAGGTGLITISGATSMLTNDNFIRFGHGNTGAVGGSGTLNMSGGTVSAGNWIGFGHEGGDGVLTQSGGAITFANEFYVGIDDNGHNKTTTGIATITGGTITQTGGGAGIFVGRNGGNGAMSITGTNPVAVTSLNEFNIGQGSLGAGGAVATGNLAVNNPNAVVTVTNDLFVGRDGGTGTLNLTAGLISANNVRVALPGNAGPATGTINAIGGTIFANTINIASAGGTVTFDSATFKAKSDTYNPFVNFTTGNSELNAGGVSIDTNGHAISWSNTFDGSGGITKTGNGNLLVPSQATAHTGGHIVNQGSLTINEMSSLGSGNVVINGGRVVLAPMGLIEGQILNNSFDTTTPNPGTRARISQDRANSTDASLFVDNSTFVYTGKFFVPGSNNVTWTFAENFDDSVYLTIDGNAGILNDNTWNNPTKTTQTLTPGVHTFEVRLGEGGGGVGPTGGWAVGFGYDTQGRDVLDPTYFQAFNDTTGVFQFHDFAGITTLANNVTLNVASSEVSVPVTGMTSAITGTISGGGGLTKTGNGLLKLSNAANSYGGVTTISGGTLQLDANQVIPNGSAVVVSAAGATFDVNGKTETVGSIASVTGSTIALNGGSLTAGGNNTTTVVNGAINGGGILAKDGTGTLTINGVQIYDALITNGGVTNIYTALGTGTSTITANATLNIYASQTLSSLTIADGVEVTFGDGMAFAPAPVKPSASFGGGGAGLVPEPGSLGLLLVGALGFIARRRRSR